MATVTIKQEKPDDVTSASSVSSSITSSLTGAIRPGGPNIITIPASQLQGNAGGTITIPAQLGGAGGATNVITLPASLFQGNRPRGPMQLVLPSGVGNRGLGNLIVASSAGRTAGGASPMIITTRNMAVSSTPSLLAARSAQLSSRVIMSPSVASPSVGLATATTQASSPILPTQVIDISQSGNLFGPPISISPGLEEVDDSQILEDIFGPPVSIAPDLNTNGITNSLTSDGGSMPVILSTHSLRSDNSSIDFGLTNGSGSSSQPVQSNSGASGVNGVDSHESGNAPTPICIEPQGNVITIAPEDDDLATATSLLRQDNITSLHTIRPQVPVSNALRNIVMAPNAALPSRHTIRILSRGNRVGERVMLPDGRSKTVVRMPQILPNQPARVPRKTALSTRPVDKVISLTDNSGSPSGSGSTSPQKGDKKENTVFGLMRFLVRPVGTNMAAVKEFYCNFCLVRTENEQAFMDHIASHLFVCGLCSYQTFSRIDMVGHIIREHPSDKSDLGKLHTMHLENVTLKGQQNIVHKGNVDKSKPQNWSNVLAGKDIVGPNSSKPTTPTSSAGQAPPPVLRMPAVMTQPGLPVTTTSPIVSSPVLNVTSPLVNAAYPITTPSLIVPQVATSMEQLLNTPPIPPILISPSGLTTSLVPTATSITSTTVSAITTSSTTVSTMSNISATGDKFLCSFCGFQANDDRTVAIHEQVHIREKQKENTLDDFQVICLFCLLSMKNIHKMKSHMALFHKNSPIKLIYGISARNQPMLWFCPVCAFWRHKKAWAEVCHHLTLRHNNDHCSNIDAFHEAYISACDDLSNFLKNLWMSGHDVEEQDIAFTNSWVSRIQNAPSQKDSTQVDSTADGDVSSHLVSLDVDAASRPDNDDAASSTSTLTIPDTSIDELTDNQDDVTNRPSEQSADQNENAPNKGPTVSGSHVFKTVDAALQSLSKNGTAATDIITQASLLLHYLEVVSVYNFTKEELAIKPSNYSEYDKSSKTSNCKMCSAKLSCKTNSAVLEEHVYRHFKIYFWECPVCGLRRSSQSEISQHLICLHRDAPLIIHRRRAVPIPKSVLATAAASGEDEEDRAMMSNTPVVHSVEDIDYAWGCPFCFRKDESKSVMIRHLHLCHPVQAFMPSILEQKALFDVEDDEIEKIKEKIRVPKVLLVRVEDMEKFSPSQKRLKTRYFKHVRVNDKGIIKSSFFLESDPAGKYWCYYCSFRAKKADAVKAHCQILHSLQEPIVKDMRQSMLYGKFARQERLIYMCPSCVFFSVSRKAQLLHAARNPTHYESIISPEVQEAVTEANKRVDALPVRSRKSRELFQVSLESDRKYKKRGQQQQHQEQAVETSTPPSRAVAKKSTAKPHYVPFGEQPGAPDVNLWFCLYCREKDGSPGSLKKHYYSEHPDELLLALNSNGHRVNLSTFADAVATPPRPPDDSASSLEKNAADGSAQGTDDVTIIDVDPDQLSSAAVIATPDSCVSEAIQPSSTTSTPALISTDVNSDSLIQPLESEMQSSSNTCSSDIAGQNSEQVPISVAPVPADEDTVPDDSNSVTSDGAPEPVESDSELEESDSTLAAVVPASSDSTPVTVTAPSVSNDLELDSAESSTASDSVVSVSVDADPVSQPSGSEPRVDSQPSEPEITSQDSLAVTVESHTTSVHQQDSDLTKNASTIEPMTIGDGNNICSEPTNEHANTVETDQMSSLPTVSDSSRADTDKTDHVSDSTVPSHTQSLTLAPGSVEPIPIEPLSELNTGDSVTSTSNESHSSEVVDEEQQSVVSVAANPVVFETESVQSHEKELASTKHEKPTSESRRQVTVASSQESASSDTAECPPSESVTSECQQDESPASNKPAVVENDVSDRNIEQPEIIEGNSQESAAITAREECPTSDSLRDHEQSEPDSSESAPVVLETSEPLSSAQTSESCPSVDQAAEQSTENLKMQPSTTLVTPDVRQKSIESTSNVVNNRQNPPTTAELEMSTLQTNESVPSETAGGESIADSSDKSAHTESADSESTTDLSGESANSESAEIKSGAEVSGNSSSCESGQVKLSAEIPSNSNSSECAEVKSSAEVSGNSNSSESAEVKSGSEVSGNSNSSESAEVKSSAEVLGNSNSSECAEVKSSAEVSGNSNSSESTEVKSSAEVLGNSNSSESAEVKSSAEVSGNSNSSESTEVKSSVEVLGNSNSSECAEVKSSAELSGNSNSSESTEVKSSVEVLGNSNSSESAEVKSSAEVSGNSNSSESTEVKSSVEVLGNSNSSECAEVKSSAELSGNSNSSESTEVKSSAEVLGNSNSSKSAEVKSSAEVSGNSNSSESTEVKSSAEVLGNSNSSKSAEVKSSAEVSGNSNKPESTEVKSSADVPGKSKSTQSAGVNPSGDLTERSSTAKSTDDVESNKNLRDKTVDTESKSSGTPRIAAPLVSESLSSQIEKIEEKCEELCSESEIEKSSMPGKTAATISVSEELASQTIVADEGCSEASPHVPVTMSETACNPALLKNSPDELDQSKEDSTKHISDHSTCQTPATEPVIPQSKDTVLDPCKGSAAAIEASSPRHRISCVETANAVSTQEIPGPASPLLKDTQQTCESPSSRTRPTRGVKRQAVSGLHDGVVSPEHSADSGSETGSPSKRLSSVRARSRMKMMQEKKRTRGLGAKLSNIVEQLSTRAHNNENLHAQASQENAPVCDSDKTDSVDVFGAVSVPVDSHQKDAAVAGTELGESSITATSSTTELVEDVVKIRNSQISAGSSETDIGTSHAASENSSSGTPDGITKQEKDDDKPEARTEVTGSNIQSSKSEGLHTERVKSQTGELVPTEQDTKDGESPPTSDVNLSKSRQEDSIYSEESDEVILLTEPEDDFPAKAPSTQAGPTASKTALVPSGEDLPSDDDAGPKAALIGPTLNVHLSMLAHTQASRSSVSESTRNPADLPALESESSDIESSTVEQSDSGVTDAHGVSSDDATTDTETSFATPKPPNTKNTSVNVSKKVAAEVCLPPSSDPIHAPEDSDGLLTELEDNLQDQSESDVAETVDSDRSVMENNDATSGTSTKAAELNQKSDMHAASSSSGKDAGSAGSSSSDNSSTDEETDIDSDATEVDYPIISDKPGSAASKAKEPMLNPETAQNAKPVKNPDNLKDGSLEEQAKVDETVACVPSTQDKSVDDMTGDRTVGHACGVGKVDDAVSVVPDSDSVPQEQLPDVISSKVANRHTPAASPSSDSPSRLPARIRKQVTPFVATPGKREKVKKNTKPVIKRPSRRSASGQSPLPDDAGLHDNLSGEETKSPHQPRSDAVPGVSDDTPVKSLKIKPVGCKISLKSGKKAKGLVPKPIESPAKADNYDPYDIDNVFDDMGELELPVNPFRSAAKKTLKNVHEFHSELREAGKTNTDLLGFGESRASESPKLKPLKRKLLRRSLPKQPSGVNASFDAVGTTADAGGGSPLKRKCREKIAGEVAKDAYNEETDVDEEDDVALSKIAKTCEMSIESLEEDMEEDEGEEYIPAKKLRSSNSDDAKPNLNSLNISHKPKLDSIGVKALRKSLGKKKKKKFSKRTDLTSPVISMDVVASEEGVNKPPAEDPEFSVSATSSTTEVVEDMAKTQNLPDLSDSIVATETVKVNRSDDPSTGLSSVNNRPEGESLGQAGVKLRVPKKQGGKKRKRKQFKRSKLARARAAAAPASTVVREPATATVAPQKTVTEKVDIVPETTVGSNIQEPVSPKKIPRSPKRSLRNLPNPVVKTVAPVEAPVKKMVKKSRMKSQAQVIQFRKGKGGKRLTKAERLAAEQAAKEAARKQKYYRPYMGVKSLTSFYKCRYCDWDGNFEYEAKEHVGKNHPDSVQEVKDLKKAALRQKSRLFFCPLKKCDVHTYNLFIYENHKCWTQVSPELMQCGYCNFVTDNKAGLLQHIKVHESSMLAAKTDSGSTPSK